MTLINGLISCVGLVPNDPWIVALVVGIQLYWVSAQQPLGCSPCGWDIPVIGCCPTTLGLWPMWLGYSCTGLVPSDPWVVAHRTLWL
jgi:hypothetical protein